MNEKSEKFTLRQWRGIRDMRVNELAAESGLTVKTINNYERDIDRLRGASYKNLEAIAKALGISVGDIFLSPTSEKPKFPVKEAS
ncbi:helix-turn-helix domain-containing protein [Lacticaseibacillus paracasei]|jgi:transcriptional regulator with XRE-family HTH domain|uniref:helix-turn-helix domain-containing protein n=1 Tax=Lacticaseibacillus paracasei TaxID=1597 RepID=UPI000E092902|nr:helix-turn-helix transcriptional regulator [Lacticaseibacillus paracasei]RDG24885.1 XRE family transcriptional regulator [Lacticaseibacillus paracasei]